MKLLFILLCLFLQEQKRNNIVTQYYKFNTCSLGKHLKNVNRLTRLSILKYSVVNNSNKAKDTLSEYFLIKSKKDTFNVIMLVNRAFSDSFIKEQRFSPNWNFDQMKDTCVNFRSQLNLNDEIAPKYPVIFGDIYLVTQD